jgi:predicted phage terminase large subunit-like protein
MNNLQRLKRLEEVKNTLTKKQYRDIKQAIERELCKENLAYLITEVLDPDYYKPIIADFHYEMMKFAEGSSKRKLILVPRGHFKSSLITVPLIIQTLLKNPNARILITNATLDNSQGFLRSIKGYMESNEKLRYLFGEFKSDKWNEGEIIIKQRNKKQIKESSVMASSVDKSIVSQHFDLIIGDDLVNRESINTREQLIKTKTYYKDLLDLLDPEGQIVIIGTRWHYDDLYQYILDRKNFDVYFRQCWENKIPIFPKKFTLEYLNQLREEKGSYEFSSQYLNSPIDDENATFKESWLTNYFTELPNGLYNYYLTLDTAGGGEGKNADSNGWILNAVSSDAKWYILEAIADKSNPTEIIDRLFAFNAKYPALQIGIEKTMYSNAFRPALEDEMRKRGKFLNIVELKAGTNKEARIKSLVSRFERKMIFLKKEYEDLRNELLRFPKSRHDDLSDALAYQMEIAEKPYSSQLEDLEPIYCNNYN